MGQNLSQKRSKFNWTPLVMAAVAGFAAWVYFHEYRGGQEREKTKLEAAAFFPFSNSKIAEFSIRTKLDIDSTSSSGLELIAKKSGDRWTLEKPYADLGDPMAIESFLTMLSTEKIRDTVVEGSDIAWKTFGLERPVVEADFQTRGEAGEVSKRTVQIGSVPAFDGSVYARLDGENRVVLMASTAKAALQKDPRDLRDKHFFPSSSATERKFTSVEVSRPGFPKLTLVKNGDVWVTKDAKKDLWPLDQGAVKAFADAVSGLRGNDVWAEDKSDPKVLQMRKLDRPGTEISLTTDDGKTLSLKLAKLDPVESVTAGVGSVRPLVFSVYKAQIEMLSKSIDDFRDLSFPFRFKVADAAAIELERPTGSVSLPTLVKRDGMWIVDPLDRNFEGRVVKPEMVDRLLSEITSFKAVKILPGVVPVPKLGPKGSLRMAFFAEKNKKLAEFIFNIEGAGDSQTVRVSSSLTPGKVFEIEKALLDALTLNLVTPTEGSGS